MENGQEEQGIAIGTILGRGRYGEGGNYIIIGMGKGIGSWFLKNFLSVQTA